MVQQIKFFFSQKTFNNNFGAIHEIKPVSTLDKSIYVKFSILDLSKYLIYKFHYKYIKRKYNARLSFTDTGSLLYEIRTKNGYENFSKDKSLFDFSDYQENSKFFDPASKTVIEKMKNEFKRKIINELAGLKSKIYSLI